MTPVDIPHMQVEVWELTNEYRESIGLPQLRYDSNLDVAAQKRKKDVIKRGNLKHDNFMDFIKDEGYLKVTKPQRIHNGENLACGFKSAKDVVEALIKSSKHRKNLADKRYTDMAIAITQGSLELKKCNEPNSILVVQLFGSRY